MYTNDNFFIGVLKANFGRAHAGPSAFGSFRREFLALVPYFAYVNFATVDLLDGHRASSITLSANFLRKPSISMFDLAHEDRCRDGSLFFSDEGFLMSWGLFDPGHLQEIRSNLWSLPDQMEGLLTVLRWVQARLADPVLRPRGPVWVRAAL